MPEQPKMNSLKLLIPSPNFDPVEAQRALQRHYRAVDPGSPLDLTRPARTFGELLECIRFNKEAIDMEFAEILDWLPWKRWRKDHRESLAVEIEWEEHKGESDVDDPMLELKYELIDIWHFILNIWIALGGNWSEFLAMYYTKCKENHSRQTRGY